MIDMYQRKINQIQHYSLGSFKTFEIINTFSFAAILIFGYVPIYLSCQINIQFISISIYFHTAYKQVDQKLDANTESQDNVKVIETNVLTISRVNNDVIAGEGYSSMYAHAESTKENGAKTIPIAT